MFIKIENLGVKFGEEYIFEKVNLMITNSHRVGLVGKNGAGKTTFLKVLAKQLKADKGTVTVDPHKAKIVYHAQVLDSTQYSVLSNEVVDSMSHYKVGKGDAVNFETEESNSQNSQVPETCFTYLLKQNKELFEIWQRINGQEDAELITQAIEEYTEKGGYQFEDRIIKACRELKLHPENNILELSGGQKTRLQFGKLLIEPHDILLLDEPTNHLDIEGLDWFYNYVQNYKGIIIIATHDRNLLTRAINKIIDFTDHRLKEYSGNYEFYRKHKHEEKIAAETKIRSNERRVDELNEASKRLEQRLTRHAQRAQEFNQTVKRIARLTKKNKSAKTRIIKQKLSVYRDNDKLTRNFKLDRQHVKLKANRSNLLTKANRIDTSRSKVGWNMKIDFHTPEISSDFVMRIADLSKSFGDKEVLRNISFDVMKNERIAIVGPNGSGKTTLLRCIAGDIREYEGSIRISDSITLGYLEQETRGLNFEKSVLDEFLASVPSDNITETEARSFLHFFLFEGDQPLRSVGTLSEGEKLKLKLAKLLYGNVNLLLLDEPTNHLDIASQEVIEKALKDFPGSIIMVSHDQELIKNIGINKTIELINL